MIRKLFIASILLSVTSSIAFADASPYVGGGIGILNENSYTGLQGNMFAGYGAHVGQQKNYYLGGEIFGNVGSIAFSGNHRNKTIFDYGASVLPGIMLNNKTMAYGRLGIAAAHYTHHNTQLGGQLGLGLQTSLTRNWDLRGEYVHTGNSVLPIFSGTRSNQFNTGVVYKFN